MPSKADDPKSEASKAMAGERATLRKGAVISDELHCPVCGGPAKRAWSDISTFNLVTFFIFLVLGPFIFWVSMAIGSVVAGVVALTWIGIVLISFWALPVTSAAAVAAQPRCSRCGHLCMPASDEASGASPPRFPLRFSLVGEAILLAFLIGGLAWLRTAPGLETSVWGLRFVAWVVLAGFALGSGLLVQAIVWQRMRARTTGSVRHGLMLLLSSVVLGAGWLALMAYDHHTLSRKYDPIARSPMVLNRAGLAALPESARDVKVRAWAFMLSGEFTLRFTAEPNDIERFLADSPSLQGVTCGTYSREKMLLRREDYVSVLDRRDTQGNEYLATEADAPRWYQQEIRGPGRCYEIKWYDGKYQGELLVNDESHTVYVHVDRF